MAGPSVHRDKEVSRGQIEAAGPGIEADKHEDSKSRINAPGGHSGHLLGQTVSWSDGAIPENVKREENKSKPLMIETLPDSTLVADSPLQQSSFLACIRDTQLSGGPEQSFVYN